jgi:hypothetical protein
VVLAGLYLAILLSYAAGELQQTPAQSATPTPAQQPQADAKQPPSDEQQPGAPPPVAALPAPQAKPARKPKKVITDDDLNGSSGVGASFSRQDLSQINDCDRNCFEQVRKLAGVTPSLSPNWRRPLLQAIDEVRREAAWQKYLLDLYDVHVKFCAVGDEKREELSRYADPHNVTPREVSIEEKYDTKFKEMQSELQLVYERQGPLQAKFTANPFAFQFSRVQADRIKSANCMSPRYPNYSPTDADDP